MHYDKIVMENRKRKRWKSKTRFQELTSKRWFRSRREQTDAGWGWLTSFPLILPVLQLGGSGH